MEDMVNENEDMVSENADSINTHWELIRTSLNTQEWNVKVCQLDSHHLNFCTCKNRP